MSLRWRASGELLCAAKHGAQPNDTYIDDRLHYMLSVELEAVVPRFDEHESGVWYWKNGKIRWSVEQDPEKWEVDGGMFLREEVPPEGKNG